MNYKDVLFELGYTNIVDHGREYRTKPIYRDSNNYTSLSINKETGRFNDFGADLKGSFEELVRITLKMQKLDEAKDWLTKKYNFSLLSKKPLPEVNGVKIFSKECLKKLVAAHSYWADRGISERTVKLFEGGIVHSGPLKDRYVFPIFNYREQLIGLSGRDLTSKKQVKWKHLGDKMHWRYPLRLNYNIIANKKEVIFVESIGDMLSLWECGIKNVCVSFGLNISLSLINFCIKMDMQKMIVAFNNDEKGNGNRAAEKQAKRLKKYFDDHQVAICLPNTHADWNDILIGNREKIYEYFKK